MHDQIIFDVENDFYEFDKFLHENKIKKILLACGNSISNLRINEYLHKLEINTDIKIIRFSEFKPNPQYESVVKGIQVFRREDCDLIMAVGGGSAMDVAKCIKLYAYNEDSNIDYFQQEIVPNGIKLVAMPTTAGSGSEATRYAVIYKDGVKQSIAHISCIPDVVLIDPSVLKTLPLYQKKAAMMDALCHGIESYWSVNSTEESKSYSQKAIQMVIENMTAYLNNEDGGNKNMLMAANISGKAINITQTTAGHAMSYKLTSMYGIAHGHAAVLCVCALWPFMIQNIDLCIDVRGVDYLQETFNDIAEAMGCQDTSDAVQYLNNIVERLELSAPIVENKSEVGELVKSVNLTRLKNNPVMLNSEAIKEIYQNIFNLHLTDNLS